jgi:hypothetical protein
MEHEGQWQLVGRYGAMAAVTRISSANPWMDSVIGLEK